MTSQKFVFSGGWQSFQVPAEVRKVRVILEGAGSGGVRGGRVEGVLAVTPNQYIWVACGAAGKPNDGDNPGPPTFGGGGSGGRGRTGNGGHSGGGATIVRLSSTTGSLKAVAGGAGGTSGDGGKGGEGGMATGAHGEKGTNWNGNITNAQGGTQSLGGDYGTSTAGTSFNGWGGGHSKNPMERKPGSGILQPGGEGGSPNPDAVCGGGGGGGGYHPGGGGAGAKKGTHPGGGGGGGANYSGGLTDVTAERGSGASSGGTVEFEWGPGMGLNEPPNPPTDVEISRPDGTFHSAEEAEVSTRSLGNVSIRARLTDPNPEDNQRMLLRLSSQSDFAAYIDIYSPWVGGGMEGSQTTINLTGLSQDTHYFVRLFGQDQYGLYSDEFNSIDFWTNRGPTQPMLFSPPENANIPVNTAVGFTWSFEDLDTGDGQSGFELVYRTTATMNQDAGPWVSVAVDQALTNYTAPVGTFKGSTYYEWQVRNKDLGGRWSDWSFSQSFYSMGVTIPPTPLVPIRDIAVDVTGDVTFYWKFNASQPGDAQRRADLRYRLVGQDEASWITRTGANAPGIPGASQFWTFTADTFAPGYQYEWQVRTYDNLTGTQSDWSTSGSFWSILPPGFEVSDRPVVANSVIQGTLGCGSYRVFIYDQGGRTPRGEIEPLSSLTFGRKRDDISTCLVYTNGFGSDCCAMYRDLRSWAHELVVFRDEKRVWEGPITRISYLPNSVEIEAKDVMAYLYRRIMRQGFNDSFQMVDPVTRLPVFQGGVQLGLNTVVDRATRIIVNALAPWDPNVLPYLTTLTHHDDARQSRVVEDYTQTAWEQIDDMAATAGLDYTTVGRRIILWDTHWAIGRLPEMRDKDFNSPPVVTEYGMQLANYGAVTNGSGVWGAARPLAEPSPFVYYGPVEMLASAYDETSAATDESLTHSSRQALINELSGQARRNIAGRWPTPLVVRVPDNSTLSPNVGVGFEQLIPGVWIPLRSTGTCREVAQWQKLDSVTVTVGENGEQVQVVMSPAPNAGEDPDKAAADAEA
jgi:hypothetical protein